jgi:hypothetical protein
MAECIVVAASAVFVQGLRAFLQPSDHLLSLSSLRDMLWFGLKVRRLLMRITTGLHVPDETHMYK